MIKYSKYPTKNRKRKFVLLRNKCSCNLATYVMIVAKHANS